MFLLCEDCWTKIVLETGMENQSSSEGVAWESIGELRIGQNQISILPYQQEPLVGRPLWMLFHLVFPVKYKDIKAMASYMYQQPWISQTSGGNFIMEKQNNVERKS